MNARHRQRNRNRISSQRRNTSTNTLSFSRVITAVGGALVLILLGATFLGDYLGVPELTVSAAPATISPNGDQTQDQTSLNYGLSEAADVSIEVFSANGSLIKQLEPAENRPAGQYVTIWGGTDDNNQIVDDGRYRIEVMARGNARAVRQSVEIRVDTEPPFLRLTNLEEVSRVAEPNLSIDGLTDPGAIVYQAGNADPIPVDNQGRFQLVRQLTEGSNILEIIASDQAGNTSRVSHEVVLITEPPDLTIVAPPTDTWFNKQIVEVSGAAPGAASVTVNKQEAILEADGTFRREIILQEGDNTIRVAVTDDVGNVTRAERLIHLKTNPPDITLNIDEGMTLSQSVLQVTGRTDPGSTVLVNNQVLPVSTLGEFQTTVNLVNGANNITVEARDIAGNTADLTRRVVFQSPTARNELEKLFDNLPSLSSLGTPLLIIVPSLILLGYLLTRPVSIQLTTDKESFTPGLPEENRTMAFTLDLSRSARTTIEVLNRHSQVVATVTSRRQRGPGVHTFYWDGYDDFGHAVPAGDYIVQALASTPGATVRSAVALTLYEDPLAHGQYRRQSTYQEEEAPLLRRTTRRSRR